MPQDFYSKLEIILKQDSRFVDQEGDLLKSNVIDAAYKVDKKLVELLLSGKELKAKFFSKVKDVLVFNINDFVAYIQDKNFLADSYTKYRNKIGLNIDGKFLNEHKEVALVWPFKDCVLEGGMTKEDEKRKEIFFNEILAQDEIDKLLTPKVLTNWKKYSQKGEEKVKDLKRDDNGTIRENLIIKGNNLLALYSLKQQFQNKIKLIYIDPPYNRGNERDDFLYNDNFKHSTWLTFMKNRMEAAKELLMKDEGLIWISINDNEAHYLKCLCDEVFDRNNFVADVIRNSTKAVTNTAIISDAHTHNFLYASNINWLKNNRQTFRMDADEKKFSNPDNDPRGKWVADPFQVGGVRPNQQYPIKNPNTGEIYYPLPGNSWKNEKKVFDKLLKEERIVFGVSGEAGPQRKRYWDEAKERGEVTVTLWSDLPTTTNATQHLKKIFGDKVFENPKPEGLIKRIIELSTKQGDVVLDFFAGSGTAGATAMKMRRQFILCEQMDYVEKVTVERLKKVVGKQVKKSGKLLEEIDYDNGGISKEVKWNGGCDFIYCELMKYNELFVDKIKKAKDIKELLKIWEEMKAKSFLNYNVDIKKFDETIDEFKKFPFAKQQCTLFDLLNKNQLYVNLSEIEDKEFKVGEEDKKMNEEFYE